MPLYIPRGKVAGLLVAMQDNPTRLWTVAEVAALLECRVGGVMAMLNYALRAPVIYRGMRDGRSVFSAQPFTIGAVPPPERKENANRRAQRVTRKKSMEPRAAAEWATSPDDLRIPRVVEGWKPPVMVAPVRCWR